MKQLTFMMLKPDAFDSGVSNLILNDLHEHGLVIEKSRELNVSLDTMKILIEHYQPVIDKMPVEFDFPGKLFKSFYYQGSKKIMPMIVSYEGNQDIIELTRSLVGKTNPQEADRHTIRGSYSMDSYTAANQENRLVRNLIHAADSREAAIREIELWNHVIGCNACHFIPFTHEEIRIH